MRAELAGSRQTVHMEKRFQGIPALCRAFAFFFLHFLSHHHLLGCPRDLWPTDSGQKGNKGRETPGQGTHTRYYHLRSTCSTGTQKRSYRGQRAASSPSDFSNCSSRLDKSAASIPGRGESTGQFCLHPFPLGTLQAAATPEPPTAGMGAPTSSAVPKGPV